MVDAATTDARAEARSRQEVLADAYAAVLGNLDEPNVRVVVEDMMHRGSVLSGISLVAATELGSQRAIGAHDFVCQTLELAGLTDVPRERLLEVRRRQRRSNFTEGGR